MIAALLSQDLALDVGSCRTRVYVRGGGVVADVPTVVSVRTRRSGVREVLAVGDDAARMIGRAPDGVEVVRPVRGGAIVVPEIAEILLGHLVRAVHGRSRWVRPRLLVAVDQVAPDRTTRALRDACDTVGARTVVAVPQPVATACGAGLDEAASAGHMIVDIGAGTTHIAVVCLGEVVASTTLDVAGDVLDGAIIRMLRRDHALLVGPATAERVKRELVGVAVADAVRLTVGGRCLRTGVPRAVELGAADVAEALREPLLALGVGVRRVLEQTPPEVASDVVDHGVILSGGGSLVRDLDLLLRQCTGLAMLPVERPDQAVVRGLGALLDGGRVFTGGSRRHGVWTPLRPLHLPDPSP